ncbi:MAG: gamma-glutamyl-gamma-aminobutyrate hydrolase family protein [Armatimonadetes bacterium]|nr:gamma-glutamyl-gamma-aminobutyrate hydrolase family protein [Armatimonadota bacterium]
MTPLIGVTMSTGNNDGGSWWLTSSTNRSYTEWVERAGGAPLCLPNPDVGLIDRYLDAIDGLLLTGGEDVQPLLYGCEPARGLGTIDVPRDRFELPLAQSALARRLPIFGICRGIQLLNVAAGGTLVQDLNGVDGMLQHQMRATGGRTVHHTVTVQSGSRLAGILGEGPVATNSYHHQAVDRVGQGLRVSAHAADQTVEALEGDSERFLLAVQWHPEVMGAEHEPSARLFEAFVAACRA